jgi:hypothetical protein
MRFSEHDARATVDRILAAHEVDADRLPAPAQSRSSRAGGTREHAARSRMLSRPSCASSWRPSSSASAPRSSRRASEAARKRVRPPTRRRRGVRWSISRLLHWPGRRPSRRGPFPANGSWRDPCAPASQLSCRARVERAVLAKPPGLDAGKIFLDLEDAVAPNDTASARARDRSAQLARVQREDHRDGAGERDRHRALLPRRSTWSSRPERSSTRSCCPKSARPVTSR